MNHTNDLMRLAWRAGDWHACQRIADGDPQALRYFAHVIRIDVEVDDYREESES